MKKKTRIGKDAVIVIALLVFFGGIVLYQNRESWWPGQGREMSSLRSEETGSAENPDEKVVYEAGGYGGNHYVGEDLPAGDYTVAAGNGLVHLRLCKEGEVLQEWTLSAEEGYERDLEHLILEEGQILISDGSPNWRMSAELLADQVPAEEAEDRQEGVKEPEYRDLSEGTYVIGEDLDAGNYRVASVEEEKEVSVISSHPLEGGIEAVLYPRTLMDQMSNYSGIRLQKGNTVVIEGGTVRWFLED